MDSRDTFLDFFIDQLRHVDDVIAKRMFGGVEALRRPADDDAVLRGAGGGAGR
jgi:hypothetical protein